MGHWKGNWLLVMSLKSLEVPVIRPLGYLISLEDRKDRGLLRKTLERLRYVFLGSGNAIGVDEVKEV